MASCMVIIPFYQTKMGVLTRALNSVFAQTYQDFSVIIVDDASPLSADQEIATLPEAQRARIQVIRQDNKGPGGARNTGLDAATHSDAKFIAFIDSDDIWQPYHLADVHDALVGHGADVFWASMEADTAKDFIRYHKFSEIECQNLLRRLGPSSFLYEITDLKRALLVKCWHYFHMSTFAAARQVFTVTRFDEAFRIAAEDTLFFFSCAVVAQKVIVSDKVAGSRGTGDNLYHGTMFGTKKALTQLYYSRLAIERIAALGNFTDAHALQCLENWRAETRDSGVACAYQALIHKRWEAFPLFFRWVSKDLRMISAVWGRARRKVLTLLG